MNTEKKKWKQWLYWFTFAIAVITVYKVLDNYTYIQGWIQNLIRILMPFLIGILIAYLLYIPCKKLEKVIEKTKIKRKARGISVFIVYVMVVILLILVINFIIPNLANSLIDFINNIGNYYDKVNLWINELPDNSILQKEMLKEGIHSIQEIDLKQYFNMEKLGQYAKGVVNAANGILNIFVAIIVSIYVLLERKQIIRFLKSIIDTIFETKIASKIANYFNRTNEIFLKFLVSQTLDAIVVGILTSIAMSLLGVKYAVLLGFFIGISNLIPYFGAIVGVTISVVITIFTGGISKALWMAIIVIVLQQIDANIINPKIVGNSLKISPLLVIFAVTIGGAYFGMIGMFLAVPVFAMIRIIIIDYIAYKNQNKLKK